MSITNTSQGVRIEPDLPYTDYMFEFPAYIWLSDEEENDTLKELGLKNNTSEDDFTVGIIAFPHEMIVGYADAKRPGQTKEDLEDNGFTATDVLIRGERYPYTCTWEIKDFKRRLNDHVKKLQDKASESVKDQMKEFFKTNGLIHDVTIEPDVTNKKSLGLLGRLRLYLNRLFSGA